MKTRHEKYIQELRLASSPLQHGHHLDRLLDRIGNTRIVMLGEASHGTSEYYTWRVKISQRLIEEHGFSFIAVEGDWPPCFAVNRYINTGSLNLPPSAGGPTLAKNARQALRAFQRWPAWMWANEEILRFVEWLKTYNKTHSPEKSVGFYGLDVYSLWESMESIITYLRNKLPEAVPAAVQAYRCFEPYSRNEAEYGYATSFVPNTCEDEVVSLLSSLQKQAPDILNTGLREEYFAAEQNALVIKNAENYYRTMVHGGSDSWNIRDWHMTETLSRLLNFFGPRSKCIVWAHNTHIGDARFTDMANNDMINLGQLARQRWGQEQTALIGFGSYYGSVLAGPSWNAPAQIMALPKAVPGSWEYLLHHSSSHNQLLIFDSREKHTIIHPYGHRAIGVVYDPELEFTNYVPTILPRRYDAFLYVDRTQALHPLAFAKASNTTEAPETFPGGV